jgi:hypothetical protein
MECVGLSALARLVTTHDVPGLLAQLLQVEGGVGGGVTQLHLPQLILNYVS